MNRIERIKARNARNLLAVMNGESQSAVIAGVTVSKMDVVGTSYTFASGRLHVYGDELEISDLGNFVYLMQSGFTIAMLYLGDE